ncbi:ABC transporter permease [Ignisphaera cupida]|uniref:ABC transporter permease n=1 Tax=Ignisphaera cupida TaxID=3050454 RepID=UPI0033071AE3
MLLLNPLIKYIISRFASYITTIFISFTFIFLLLKAMPTSIVEAIIASMTSLGMVYDPQGLIMLRESLYEIFGLKGSLWDQYITFLRRFLTLDFGPSTISFPTPAKELVYRQLPWTLGLLSTTTVLSWLIGNMLGALASFKRESRVSKVLRSVAVTLYPIPYYIMALVLVYLLAYLVPLFPIVGGGVSTEKITLNTILEIVYRSALPALSIMIPSMLGWWFLSSSTLTLTVMSEDYYIYGELRGLPRSRIFQRYILRNILLPQTTALALALGGIFGGALLTEAIFAYPGLGQLLYRAVGMGDYATAMSILSLSIIGIATATLIIDIIYPFIDPRVRYR